MSSPCFAVCASSIGCRPALLSIFLRANIHFLFMSFSHVLWAQMPLAFASGSVLSSLSGAARYTFVCTGMDRYDSVSLISRWQGNGEETRYPREFIGFTVNFFTPLCFFRLGCSLLLSAWIPQRACVRMLLLIAYHLTVQKPEWVMESNFAVSGGPSDGYATGWC